MEAAALFQLEKVVKQPQKPVVSPAYTAGKRGMIHGEAPAQTPIKNEPATFARMS